MTLAMRYARARSRALSRKRIVRALPKSACFATMVLIDWRYGGARMP